jgi:beta-lactamase regulating signal transducer with metallopeptidase domain
MERFLLNLGKLSLIGGVVIGAVLAARPLWRERYGPRGRCFLWLGLSLFLLLPIDYSVQHGPVQMTAPAQHTVLLTQGRPAVVRTEDVPRLTSSPPVQTEQGDVKAQPRVRAVPLETVLFWCYLAGVGGYVAVQWVRYARFRRLVRRWRRRAEGYETVLRETARALSCPVPRLYICEAVTTPALTGFVKPVLLLPRETYGEAELRFILRHELYHLKRRDMLYKLVLTAANALHWFNPLVYLMLRQADEDIELSCDDAATADLTHTERAEYSRTLLAAVQAKTRPLPVTTRFGGTAQRLRRRIANIMGKKKKQGAGIAVLVLIGVLTGGCAVSWSGGAAPGDTGASYESMKGYVTARMDEVKKQGVDYQAVPDSQAGAESAQTVHDTVEDVRLEWLRQTGAVEDLAPEGTLEVWEYHYVVKPANGQNLLPVLAGGMYRTDDGYVDFEGQGGHYVFALRAGDGRYTILKDQPVNDGAALFGWHEHPEEALFDWYVDEADLNLPKYVLSDLLGEAVEDAYGSEPQPVSARRWDGDGWHLYIPVTGWEQTEEGNQWRSSYQTGSELSVNKSVDSVETMEEFYRSQGQTKNEDGAWCVTAEDGTHFATYLQAAPQGGCYILQTCWIPAKEAEAGQQAFSMEKQVQREEKELRAMALHFALDS